MKQSHRAASWLVRCCIFGAAFALLTGCMGTAPSSFPRPPQLPQNQQQVSQPSAQQQPGTSGSRASNPSSSPASSPLPSVPSPPSGTSVLPTPPGPPSLPSGSPQPTPTMVPQQETGGQERSRGSSRTPSLPGLPNPLNLPTGAEGEGEDSDAVDGEIDEDQQGNPAAGGQSVAPPGDENLPAAGNDGLIQHENEDGEHAGDTAGELGVPDSGELNSQGTLGEGILVEDEPNDGWEVSNQLPEAQRTREADMPTVPTSGDEETESGNATEAELERELGELDGEILADRQEEEERLNQRRSGATLPDLDGSPVVEEQGDGTGNPQTVGGSSTTPIPTATRRVVMDRSEPKDGPNAKFEDDVPDARDDDVIARQLREAAMAEADPELREKLWEEYRRYKARRQ